MSQTEGNLWGNPMGRRPLAHLRRLVGAGRLGPRRVGYCFAGNDRDHTLSPGSGPAQRAVGAGRKLRLKLAWDFGPGLPTPAKLAYSTPGRGNYMVYRVFTVYSGPAIVHNLFKLC